MRETSVAASIVLDMLQYLERKGVPTADAMRESAIDVRIPSQPDDRASGSQVERLWDLAVRRLNDPLIGLHMAEGYNPGTLDILGYVVLSCSTVGDVLDRFARYVRVLNDGMRVEVVRERSVAFCRCTFVESMNNYLLRRPREAMDTTWAGLARELGRLTAKPLTATEIWFRHSVTSPAQKEEYRRLLGAPVRFGATENRFILPISHLDEPILSANPALLAVFSQHADTILSRLDSHGSPAHRVMQVVAERMKGTVPTLTEVARELAMSDRNLQRALRSNGTSFQRVVDDLRRDLAISHLANPTTSAGQVGFLLGFSEPSAFHRAFRRWTGKAPSEFRRSATPMSA